MLFSRSALLASISLFALAYAQNPFSSPSAGDKLTVGESFEISWTASSSIDEVGISICRGSGQDCDSIGSFPNTGSYDWTPSTSLAPDNTYFFILTGPAGYLGTSPTFGIQGGSSNSGTSSSTGPASTTGSSTTSGPASTTSQSSATSGPATATPDNQSSSGGSGAIIGGAIGAVVVVVALAVGGFFWMRKRNQKKIAAVRAQLGTPSPDDDVEAGKKMKRSSMMGVAGKTDKKPQSDAFKSKEELNNGIQLAELPAMQQEPVEMMANPGIVGGKSNHFFAMELDSREIPRPGSSSVKPDVEINAAGKASMDKHETNRGVSIDGTTVNSETERPKTAGTIDQIKEESREGSSRQQAPVQPRSETPVAAPARTTLEETRPAEQYAPTSNNAASRPRDSTPQIRSSIPSLPAFDFDSSKF